MTKNIVIGVLVLLLIGESGYLLVKRQQYHEQLAVLSAQTRPTMPPAGPNARGGKPVVIGKGTNLTSTSLFQFAYEIAPTVSDSAKSKLTGFSMTSVAQSDGSTLITLTPKDSDDQDQQYTVKKGQILYYIEQTPLDDKADQDKDLNYRDDYGIVTDANGIVQ